MARLTFINYIKKLNESINHTTLNNTEYVELNQVKTAVQDPHEALTAACCLIEDLDNVIKDLSDEQSINNFIKTLLILFGNIEDSSSKIVGLSDADFEIYKMAIDVENSIKNTNKKDYKKLSDKLEKFINTCRNELPAAISAARQIKSNFKNIKKVYITGATWPEEIKDFKISAYGMSDFNSADIVCADGDNNYLGVSLKKKAADHLADPTLINKSIMTFFKSSETPNIIKNKNAAENNLNKNSEKLGIADQLENTINNWYNIVVGSKEFQKLITGNKRAKEVKYEDDQGLKALSVYFKKGKNDVNALEAKTLKNNIRDFINTKLKNKGSLFEQIKKILNSDQSKKLIHDNLFDIVLKPELLELIKNKRLNKKFDFALVTGIGRLKIDKKTGKISLQVSEGKYIPISIIENFRYIEKINKTLRPGNFEFVEAENKNNFDGTGPAKLFYSLNWKPSDGQTIKTLDIEIRYKGDYRAAPQFQATLCAEFLDYIKTLSTK